MTECLLGLGSNVGDRAANLLGAIEALRGQRGIRLVRHSSFVESVPVGGPADQGPFLNAAAIIETSLPPGELLNSLLSIERGLGRVRSERWGPRTIDLDVLLYGDQVVETAELCIPHPRFAERRFALVPAAEIAGQWRHPTRKHSIAELLTSLGPPAEGEVGMQVVFSPREVQTRTLALRESGHRVGLVPTMGALHAGHLSLVEMARSCSDTVIATIFVNPAQFGPQEDFSKYPRTLDRDLEALAAAGCDLVFVPETAAIYPSGFSTYVEPPAVSRRLEGVCREGHFRGVATVVLKLFHLIPAQVACFGQKDYQQLQVIRRMVLDLDVPIEIVACPTVRERDGLAMSSRNRYLSAGEREQALAISRALMRAGELVASGEQRGDVVVAEMRDMLIAAGIERIDYIAIADPDTLEEKTQLDGPAVALIAAHVGTTRLIDNQLLHPKP